MFTSCQNKQNKIKKFFSSCLTKEEKYQKIIKIGQSTSPLPDQYKVSKNEVHGCQSLMYIHAYEKNGEIFFEAHSDSLISSGLAALLTKVYSGEEPEVIIKCEPNYLDELGISASLSPNRANGLYNIHLRMKQIALELFIKNKT